MQEKIVELIPSKSLKEYIKQNGIRFSPYQLMQLADDYARSYEERIALLTALEPDEETKPVLQQLIENGKRELALFLAPESDTVYELRIQLNAQDYNENYFCKSFESAVQTVKAFLKEYECESELNEKSKICLTKWHMFSEDSIDFEKSDLGTLELNEKLEIKSAEYWGENGYTFTYPHECYDFSDFLSGYHPIQYEDYRGEVRCAISVPVKCYSVEEDDREELITDEAYVIPIDRKVDLTHDDFQFYYHEHVQATELELVHEEELSDFMRANYKKLKQYFTEVL